MTPQAKYMYLARRRPTLDRQGFTRRWRQHGALGMSLPRWVNVWRYVHCDVLDSDGPGIAAGYDGVGVIWYRSLAARGAHASDHASQATMEADEAETFSEPVANCGVLCAEQVLLDGAHSGLKLVRFLARPACMSITDFDSAWSLHQAAVLAYTGAAGGLCRYVCNPALPAEHPGGWGLGVQGVEELWFDDAARLQGFCAALQLGRDGLVRPEPWTRATSVITNEVVLYNNPTAQRR